jgi:E3 ubiquitin-protein ligase SHPRH
VTTASDLAAADVVLTTFDVLRKDIAFEVGAPSGRSSRHSKYPVFPTPLTRLTWWRVVIDEAQMIEGSSSKAAQMANHLHMENRWCVTGTPLSRGLEDIYGLVRFLKVCCLREARLPIVGNVRTYLFHFRLVHVLHHLSI